MAAKTISLSAPYRRREAVAGGAITPGMLVQIGSTVVAHATLGGNAERAFALENDLVGGGIGDAYASGETVQIGFFGPGDRVNALLAHGENVSAGDYLESDGNGALAATVNPDTDDSGVTIYAASIVAKATAALNNTTGANARLTVEVL